MKPPLSWIELDTRALAQNVTFLRSLNAGNSEPRTPYFCAAVKANAYGHGLSEIVAELAELPVEYIAVHSVSEAALARQAGWSNRILCVGYIQLSDTSEALELSVEPTIYNLENLRAWAREARKRKRRAPIHLKVETGANRQGIAPESLGEFAAELQRAPELTPLGVSTHFANIEDTTDHTFAKLQLSRFQAALKTLERLGASPQLRHTASSAAHLVFPETRFDMIRAGIAMYGHWPSKETFLSFRHQYPNHDGRDALRPMLSFKCRIAQIKTVKKGETVGYGLSFTAERDLKIAVLPVGYFDGLDRKLSNVGHVLIGGQRARIVGRVSMNNMTVDVTELAHEKENLLEAVVTLIGVDGAERITAEMIADWTGTIQYEALARLGESLPRVVI